MGKRLLTEYRHPDGDLALCVWRDRGGILLTVVATDPNQEQAELTLYDLDEGALFTTSAYARGLTAEEDEWLTTLIDDHESEWEDYV